MSLQSVRQDEYFDQEELRDAPRPMPCLGAGGSSTMSRGDFSLGGHRHSCLYRRADGDASWLTTCYSSWKKYSFGDMA
jgi:hypothetical protein